MEETIEETVRRIMAQPNIRGALDLLAQDRHRTVLGVCTGCWFEISDNDRTPHVCPPEP